MYKSTLQELKMIHGDHMKSKNTNKYNDELISLGNRIAYFRRQAGMTQQQLAERAGISLGFLSQVEAPNMAMGVSLTTLFSIADALDTPVYKFLMFD